MMALVKSDRSPLTTLLACTLVLGSALPLNAEAATCNDLFLSSEAKISGRERQLAPYEVDFPPVVTIDKATGQTRLQSFVKIREGRELFIDYLKPAPGKPIAVIINGLTYRTGNWDAFVNELKGEGIGILRYDMRGQGKTMAKEGYPDKAIQHAEQARDLNSLLRVLDIRAPVHLITLSYGSAIGAQFASFYPKKVASLVLMAPFTKPLDTQDLMIRFQIAQTRILAPWNRTPDDVLYDAFLKQTVYTTYPLSEPVVLEHPFKLESTFRMVQGVRKLHLSTLVDTLPKGTVHLVVAKSDQYIGREVLEEFWQQLPPDARASRLFLQHSEHKIPEAMPRFSANWTKLIINQDARLQDGATWEGGAWLGHVESGGTRIDMN
jgi:pimeloyl-ACP methyl ester carboxylesterase